jgi:ribosomal protein RSM22 (predicted rRNA methylase)
MEPFNQRSGYRFSEQALQLFQSLSRSQHGPSLAPHIATLSRLFTQGRGELSARYLDDPALAAGYGAYFLPVNFAKIQMLLNELPKAWADKPRLSVLDVGAGPGTASLAVRDWLSIHNPSRTTPLHVTAIDHSGAALAELSRLWSLYGRQTDRDRLLISTEQLEQLPQIEASSAGAGQAPFDLIIVANSLNELFHDSVDWLERRAGFLARLLSTLRPDGTLMILEPALRSTARALHQVRDRLLEQGLCGVFSPCLHEGPCPALVKAEDWCHEERAWEAPPWIAELDQELHFIKDALKFSYLLLRKDGRTIVPRRPDVYRVVSERLVYKGEQRAWVCNERGRSEVGRLDRKVTPTNADFDACHRGALILIDGITRKERNGKLSDLGRIEQNGVVKIVREA